MTYLAIVRLLLSFANLFMERLNREQLLEAGRDREISASLSKIQQRVLEAKKITQEIANVPDSDINKHLRDGKWMRD